MQSYWSPETCDRRQCQRTIGQSQHEQIKPAVREVWIGTRWYGGQANTPAIWETAGASCSHSVLAMITIVKHIANLGTESAAAAPRAGAPTAYLVPAKNKKKRVLDRL